MSIYPCRTQVTAPKPKTSMFVEVHPWTGINQVRRSNGKFGRAYSSDVANSMTELVLGNGDSYIGGSTNVLTLYTDNSVWVEYNRADDPSGDRVRVQVRHLLVLDEPTAGFIITNEAQPDEEHSVARVWVNFATSNLGSSIAGVQTVNGQVPDSSGNVEVDTGVMQVSGQDPDSSGNVLAVTTINQNSPDPDGNIDIV